jgi:hypothetical protein
MDAVEARTSHSAESVRPGTRWLLVAFTVLTAFAVVELLLLVDVADRFWAWTIPNELTAAFLGAAYAAGFVLAFLALRQHEWSRIRVPVVTVTAFTWLTAIATGIHLHRLNLMTGGSMARAAAWVWLAVYLVIPLACLAVVIDQERRLHGPQPVLRPMPNWLTALLAVEGTALAAAGVVLFGGGLTVHHHVSAADFWPWELMPLGAMVIGAWLIALGLAAGLVIGQHDLSRLLVSAVTYTAFGLLQFVVVIWHWPHLRRHGLSLWAYLALLAAMVGTGAYGMWAARRGSATPARPDTTSGLAPAGTAGP